MCTLLLHRSLVAEWVNTTYWFTIVFSIIYSVPLAAFFYTGFVDAGQLDHSAWLAVKTPRPKRAHKAWQYDRPIMRYDHYCRWVTNCIGLRNHREFFIMVTGFFFVAVAGAALDVILLIHYVPMRGWVSISLLTMHLVYSLIFGYFVIPIYRIHVTFVSRNELAHEWKNDEFYIVRDELTGEPISVKELDSDTFNAKFDSFEYDPTLNQYDHGCAQNCCLFWCTSRHSADQKGDF